MNKFSSLLGDGKLFNANKVQCFVKIKLMNHNIKWYQLEYNLGIVFINTFFLDIYLLNIS